MSAIKCSYLTLPLSSPPPHSFFDTLHPRLTVTTGSIGMDLQSYALHCGLEMEGLGNEYRPISVLRK